MKLSGQGGECFMKSHPIYNVYGAFPLNTKNGKRIMTLSLKKLPSHLPSFLSPAPLV